ncbi:Glutamate mutase sigma subunit [Candidatus Lokiarchaeum ossiferum]|uniref:Glutamate mutase sigma subunit n=1 Tax=Candidatus Lokiarchaeum ossiferum TaxID=2951803 RepID=A0ABY6HS12_9ARCH|nr:Glutamate mutase sigma subunit [Candidatus Lokiarchaeum sp. B-35]
MGGGLYSSKKHNFDTHLDLSKLKPYGDTMNDGKVQLSFTLPIPDGDKAVEVARQYTEKLGFLEPDVVYHEALDKEFTFFVVYGSAIPSIDYNAIKVQAIEVETMSMKETDEYIKNNIKRNVVVVGATTGTDAHTVGIDAIMNMKGYMGHYGLERYSMVDAYNLGAQVPNEEFIRKAIELKADVMLVSQTVTQKGVHIQNLTELVELIEAEGIRDKVVLIAGGPRLTNDLAKELGFDAGFGPGKYADAVASFMVEEIVKRNLI